MGALFYFIPTGKHEEVDRLGSLCESASGSRQTGHCSGSLSADQYYCARRDAIPEPFFRDELLLLCLRAMVRGSSAESLASRIDRGPEAAQALLRETRALYRAVLEDVMSEPLHQKVRQGLFLAAPRCSVCCSCALARSRLRLFSVETPKLPLPNSGCGNRGGACLRSSGTQRHLRGVCPSQWLSVSRKLRRFPAEPRDEFGFPFAFPQTVWSQVPTRTLFFR